MTVYLKNVFLGASVLMSLFCFIGNILVCVIVISNPSMRTFTNYLLVNLAIADLVYGPLETLAFFQDTIGRNLNGNFFHCHLAYYIVCVTCAVSIQTLTLIAVERYFAVVKPFKKFNRKNRRVFLYLLFIWGSSLLTISPMLLLRPEYKEHDICIFGTNAASFIAFYTSITVIYLVLPSCVIVCCYSYIVCGLWYSILPTGPGNCHGNTRLKSRRRLARMLLVVSSFFVITWFSVFAAHMYYLYSRDAVHEIARLLVGVLVQLNSCINPIVYSLHSAVFRKHILRHVCCFCFKKHQTEPTIALRVCCSFFKKRQTAPSFTGIQLEKINTEDRQKVFLVSYKQYDHS